MSRVAKNPLLIPTGVEVTLVGKDIKVKGPKGILTNHAHDLVDVVREDKQLRFTPKAGAENSDAIAGTARALVKNMIEGVSKGFERKLVLIGVGYKAQVQGKALNLNLGFSHQIKHEIPHGITIDTPIPTEIIVKGIAKELVGEVAAKIRAYRPPEPYKGKGVRYDGEVVVQKEGKKK